MLIHIVCWKYRSEMGRDRREIHRNALRALSDLVDGMISMEVGADILHLDRSFDTGLVISFRDRESLDVYTDHPEHQTVAAMGREISEKVISVDFYTGED
jgi:hypothetical protein